MYSYAIRTNWCYSFSCSRYSNDMLTTFTKSWTPNGCSTLFSFDAPFIGLRTAAATAEINGTLPARPIGRNRRFRPRLSRIATASIGVLPPPRGWTARNDLQINASLSLTKIEEVSAAICEKKKKRTKRICEGVGFGVDGDRVYIQPCAGRPFIWRLVEIGSIVFFRLINCPDQNILRMCKVTYSNSRICESPFSP